MASVTSPCCPACSHAFLAVPICLAGCIDPASPAVDPVRQPGQATCSPAPALAQPESSTPADGRGPGVLLSVILQADGARVF